MAFGEGEGAHSQPGGEASGAEMFKKHKMLIIVGGVGLLAVVYFIVTASSASNAATATTATAATPYYPQTTGNAITGAGGAGTGSSGNLAYVGAGLQAILTKLNSMGSTTTSTTTAPVTTATPVSLPPTSSPAPVSTPIVAQKAPAPAQTFYTVQPGNNLWDIAASHGLGTNWQAIYNANRGLIGGNPNLIQPGQRLLIP